jgi:DNA invertase Pin-like site-specific DNA recombinase
MSDQPVRAVAYYRMSTKEQDKSIPQQKAEMEPRCRLEGVAIVHTFEDEGISGGGMKKRDAFLEMLAFCQERYAQGEPLEAIVCWDTSRFSRATSIKTARYIDEFQEAGVHRLFTWEKWIDFRKEEDRAIFLLNQDFKNHGFAKDHSARTLRGKRTAALAGFFTGSPVPYAFGRILLDEKNQEVARIPRGESIKFKKKGWHTELAPVPADDPDPARQLERQTVVWLYQTFDSTSVSFRSLATRLNERGVPSPGELSRTKGKPGWSGQAVRRILTDPIYRGLDYFGETAHGQYHRLDKGELKKVDLNLPVVVKAQEEWIPVPLKSEAIVGRELWERVQRKIAERRVRKGFPRAGGYVLSQGILHCGQCGQRMHGTTFTDRSGRKTYSYKKYICSSAGLKPGVCRHYSIREDRLLPALVKKIQEVYLNPERLEGLRQQLLAKVQAKQEGNPALVENLTKRLDKLEAEIVQGRRNMLKVKDDEAFTELDAELSVWLKQRDRLRRELAAAQKAQAVPSEEAMATVTRAMGRLEQLREQLDGAAKHRDKLGEVIRLLVSRIDLYFENGSTTKRGHYRFVKGVVKLRMMLEVVGDKTQATV